MMGKNSMKTLITLMVMACTSQAAFLTADFVGTPHDYGLYRGQELVLAFLHSGNIAIDAETGDGAIELNFAISGGSMAGYFGGIGQPFRGAFRIFVPHSSLAMLWEGLLALPDQPYYFGGDVANQIPIDVVADCVEMGALLLGCGSSMHLMASMYMSQGMPILNIWLDGSILSDFDVYSGDMVGAMRNLQRHSPEPSSLLLVAGGLMAAVAKRRRRSW